MESTNPIATPLEGDLVREIRWMALDAVTPQDTLLVGRDLAEQSRVWQTTNRPYNGFVLTASAYKRFMARNGMQGLVEELILTLEPQMAQVIIEKNFSKARYSGKEVQALRDFYFSLQTPLMLLSRVIDEGTGETIGGIEHCTKLNVTTFDAFIDGIVHMWYGNWRERNLAHLARVKRSQYAVVVWVIEDRDHIRDQADRVATLQATIQEAHKRREAQEREALQGHRGKGEGGLGLRTWILRRLNLGGPNSVEANPRDKKKGM